MAMASDVFVINIHSCYFMCLSYQERFVFRRSKRDSDIFYSYYVQSCECPDPVGRVLQLFAKSGVTTLTRIGVNLINTYFS
jgi:hypothetical protein